jgi:hypothetical protein
MPMRHAEGPTYKDWPECLQSYAWLVREGLRNAERMFNLRVDLLPCVCKVCGSRVARSELALHVQEHARQLKLIKS